MTQFYSTLTLLLGISLSPLSFSSTQVTLQVKGTIQPPSCDIRFDNSGILDWQQIDPVNLSATKSTELATKNIKLSISCETPALFAVRSKDVAEKAGEAKIDGKNDVTHFSLGTTSAGKIIGAYKISTSVGRSLVDGQQMKKINYSTDGGKTWEHSEGVETWKRQGEELVSFSDGVISDPIPAQNVVFDINVTPYIAPFSEFSSPDGATLAGSATFDIVYL